MDRTQHKNLRLPQYIDPADIMEINRNFDDIDMWAEQTDLELSKKMDIGSPSRSNILFLDGIIPYANTSHANIYIKTQNNIVWGRFWCYRMDGEAFKSSDLLFVLPVGFRPYGNIYQGLSTVQTSQGLPGSIRKTANLFHSSNETQGRFAINSIDGASWEGMTEAFGTFIFLGTD